MVRIDYSYPTRRSPKRSRRGNVTGRRRFHFMSIAGLTGNPGITGMRVMKSRPDSLFFELMTAPIAVLGPELQQAEGKGHAMRLLEFDPKSFLHPPEVIAAFVRRLLELDSAYHGIERRTESRRRIALPVAAVPLDGNYDSAGRTLVAVVRDISDRGICFIHTAAIESPFMALELKDQQGHKLKALIEVVRSRRISPYYEIGGRFLTKLYPPLKKKACTDCQGE